jgi:small subunit ribosomal protein S21
LRRFKKRCDKEGLVKEMRKREYYEPPSVRRRREACILKKRIIKEELEAKILGGR